MIEIIKEQSQKIDRNYEELKKLRDTVAEHQGTTQRQLSYASAVATSPRKIPLDKKSALHSILIESKDEKTTGDEVMKQVREAVNVKDGWVTVEKVRKTKDRKVVLGCRTVQEREKVKERLQNASTNLKFEEMKNHDPMAILRDVMSSHSDKEILLALRNQNGVIFHGLEGKDDRMEVKFRRKARNSLMSHIVL
ncbi:hypothetical protein ABMA28_009239 [Loxostege sticticalis]|uniref:Uncharacterized protein n=1 Tax=Loxostege sticticalis TaxID=481309 RepID=A0ABD0SCN0_LOXSC